MRTQRPGGAPRHRAHAPNRLLPLLLVVAAVVSISFVAPVVGHHGGRGIGSLLACDRPVEPPRCTSVGDDFLHYVAFDASLSEGLASSLSQAMAEAYGPTKLHMIVQPEITDVTDVIAFSGDFGDNGAAGWVYCPPDSPQGLNIRGDRWCRHQELFFNLNPRYSIFFDDDASRDHVACHELGHTVGLRHWGNPPESAGPAAATCMNSNTPNGPTTLHQIDRDHIDAYPYRFWPTPDDVTISRAPIGSVEATGTVQPATVAELLAASDAVVHGRVVAVELGRSFGPPSRPLAYASVTVAVRELLVGDLPASHRHSLVLEVPLFDGAASLARLEGDLAGADRILFLRNKGASARDAGLPEEAVAADAGFYRLAAFDAELAIERGAVRGVGEEASVLDAFDGAPLDAVLRQLRTGVAR